MEEVSNFSPAMAVPTTVKIPEPITAPIPRAVSDHGPSVFLRQCSGSSESLINLSIDLVANNCFRSVSAPGGSDFYNCVAQENPRKETTCNRIVISISEITRQVEREMTKLPTHHLCFGWPIHAF